MNCYVSEGTVCEMRVYYGTNSIIFLRFTCSISCVFNIYTVMLLTPILMLYISTAIRFCCLMPVYRIV